MKIQYNGSSNVIKRLCQLVGITYHLEQEENDKRILHLKSSDESIDDIVTIPGDDITIDDALSDISENPVQNKVISAAMGTLEKELEKKQGALTFDTAPTENSINPVTSAGIYTAIAQSRANITVISIDTEITANMWQDGAVTITSSEIHADSVVTVGLQLGEATAELVQAAGNALIVAQSQAEGVIVLECLGKIPTMTIPITLTILSDTSYAVIQTINFTVLPSDWVDGVAKLTNSNFLPDSIVYIGLQVGASTEEIANAAANAIMAVKSHTEGMIELVCFGTVPSIALPISLTIINAGG